MAKAMVLQHLAFEDLGSIAAVLSARHIATTVDEVGMGFDAQRAVDADLLIVLGGPIGVADGDRYPVLTEERRILVQRLADGQATLGICLGAQLLAAAAGGSVQSGAVDEIGWAPVELTPAGADGPLGLLESQPVLHWHQDAITRLPSGAIHLAQTPTTRCQAFTLSKSLGLQFHLEVHPNDFERWLIGHAGGIAQRDPTWFAQQRRLASEAASLLPNLAQRVLHAWLDEVGL